MRFVWIASIAQIDADSGEAKGNRLMKNECIDLSKLLLLFRIIVLLTFQSQTDF